MELLFAATVKTAFFIFQLPPEFYSCGKDAVPGPDVTLKTAFFIFQLPPEFYSCGKDAVPGPDVTLKTAFFILQLPPEFYSCGKDAVPGPDVPIRCQKSLFLFKKEIQIATGKGHTDEKDELFSY
jgi:ABC-type transport system involved in cytochrome bd biosynthesis fused ATPase/permease subunit